MGLEVALGVLIAWLVSKARRAAQGFDGVADEAVDASVARVRTC